MKICISKETKEAGEGFDLKGAVAKLYNDWNPETEEGQQYKDDLQELIVLSNNRVGMKGRLDYPSSEPPLEENCVSKGSPLKKTPPNDPPLEEAASEYVYGVKNPSRVANIYRIKIVKR